MGAIHEKKPISRFSGDRDGFGQARKPLVRGYWRDFPADSIRNYGSLLVARRNPR